MALQIKDGDYVPAGAGLLRLNGDEVLLQRVLFRLTARRGGIPFLPTLGSRLHQLGRITPALRESAAQQYVAEALAEEDVTVEAVTLSREGRLRIGLKRGGVSTAMELTVEG